jgi:HlyD family secretion protein
MLEKSRLLLAVCLLLPAACTKSKQSSEAPQDESATAAPVQVAPVKQETIHNFITAEAILYPIKQATIVPKISTPVSRFLVQRGDHVKQGQLLAVLEDRDLVAAKQENEQLYKQAQANYQMTVSATVPDDMTRAKSDVAADRQAYDAAQKIVESRQNLYRQGALAERQLEDARVAMAQARSALETAQQHLASLESVGQKEQTLGAQAQVGAAKAHYQGAAAQVSYAQVRSPISGVVSDRPTNVGEMANSGSALLSIVDISRVVAHANVPVDVAASLRVGRPATISGAGTELEGKVTVVSPAVDPNTTTVQIWVEAANPGERMKLGSTVQVTMDAGEIRDAIMVPNSALLSSEEGGEKVMVAGADSRAHERPVKVGIRSGDDVQVLAGLKVGEQVITQGALGLDDKAKIEISKPGKEDDSGKKDADDKQ